jgi:DNA-binding CsgD family transcriptional regulator
MIAPDLAADGTRRVARRQAGASAGRPNAAAALAIVRPLWDRSCSGWFVYAGDGRLLYANPAVAQITGSNVTIGSRVLVPTVLPQSRLAYERVMKRIRLGHSVAATVVTLPVPVGAECRLIRVSLVAAPDWGSDSHAVIGLLQDVTVRADPVRDAALERLSHLERVLACVASELASVAPEGSAPLPAMEGLSPRQREILQMLVDGQRAAVIARQLHLSVHTVRNHTKAIFRFFGVHSQSELLVRIRHRSTTNS